MSNLPTLSQLHDIHLPTNPAWWPLAPGWYLSIVIILFLIYCLIRVTQPWRSNRKIKRQALQLLAQYQQNFMLTQNAHECCAQISVLLRNVALAYFSRKQVASLQGLDWIEFLNYSAKNINFDSVHIQLLVLPWKPSDSMQYDLTALFALVTAWIKQRKHPCSN